MCPSSCKKFIHKKFNINNQRKNFQQFYVILLRLCRETLLVNPIYCTLFINGFYTIYQHLLQTLGVMNLLILLIIIIFIIITIIITTTTIILLLIIIRRIRILVIMISNIKITVNNNYTIAVFIKISYPQNKLTNSITLTPFHETSISKILY